MVQKLTKENNMNELYVSDYWIYFKTNAKTYDEAIDDFIGKCIDAGIIE